MLPSFTPPIYEPHAYAYAGLAFSQLPTIAQHYLTTVARLMPPAAYDPSAIHEERSRLSLSLFRSLQGIDIAMVEKRQEAYSIAKLGDTSPTHEWYETALQKDQERLHEVFNVLLPERERTLDEFMIKFDALVWLDVDGHEDFSLEQWQEHRNNLSTPILNYTGQALVALDSAVSKKNVEGDDNWRSPSVPVSPIWRTHSPRYPRPDKAHSEMQWKVERTLQDIRNKHRGSAYHPPSSVYGGKWHSRKNGRPHSG
ncbi:hypothetical protein SERLA73DRAFT_181080 [Serpula lacrymans var. lacrymans S7.3]|uniref:Uncharacterized protein n=2 Tax=Serpula lacrymans var. lacrymans TaxID=341189 RepID=F8PUR4_SERL3|nr:uncharacterized protein SERLADRAFT_466964 [Serpula lacrymans var. lacrymans S7.9]EGO00472.1 hypothetical protein SERLA73DRAFT_181080 [Serpula lacrymans var. lacrymans S7.3]EGO26024.1 hypothetical protein SERLADRAFT_466964 [Serpula lacrymans var. lacrymans S7.9]